MTQKSLEEILTDHAYCEQKAASTGISLIQGYPEKEDLVESLVPVVAEEWGHFRMVLDLLKKRGLQLGAQRKDEYVSAIMSFMQKGGGKKKQLLERLLVAALIEARSCERFRLLSKGLEDEELRVFYRKLMDSEAGHYRLFLDLAFTYFPKEQVLERWQEYLDYEAKVMDEIEIRGDRMH